jgi:polysaccharide biosynthesis protein PslG
MTGKLRGCVAVLAVFASLGAFATTAQALPAGFWGVVPQSELSIEQFQRLSQGGAESIRLGLNWGSVQPSRGGEFQWASFDNQLEAAAKAGIHVLPFFAGAPTWAVPSAPVPGSAGAKAPAHLPVTGVARSGWIAFISAATARYGRNGNFWSEHPTVPKVPLRVWQIWNEPNFKYFVAKPNPTEYGQLLKISSTAMKAADPGAKAILAGLFAKPKGSRNARGEHKSLNWYASDFIEQMYLHNPGIKAAVGGVSLHPYTYSYRELTPDIEELRHVLARVHDPAKPLYITELGWSSEAPNRADQFAKGPAGQASQLTNALTLLRNNQAKWRLQGVYWFSVDDLAGACNFCGGSGLFGKGFKPKQSWSAFVKLTGGTP